MNTSESNQTPEAARTTKVVIAYDGSEAAREAIAGAARIIGSGRALVVTVWEEGLVYAGPVGPSDGLVAYPMVDPGVALDVDRRVHAGAEQVSEEGAALARSLGLDAEPLAVPDDGNIAMTILNVAVQEQADAVVVGSRGLSGIRAKLEGSTSKGLLKHATCPVLVVHEPDEAPS